MQNIKPHYSESTLRIDSQKSDMKIEESYENKCDDWRNKGYSENRGMTAEILKEANKRGLTEVDLSGPNFSSLSELPDFPESVKSIRLDGLCSLKTLPKLPRDLQKLYLKNCPLLDRLPQEWPRSLEVLVIRDCESLEELPQWPPLLKKLTLSDCKALKKMPQEWPPSLEELSIDSSPSLLNFDDSLDSLDDDALDLPESLMKSNLLDSLSLLRSLKSLTSLKIFRISGPPLYALPIPNSVENLTLECEVTTKIKIPNSVKILTVKRLDQLPKLQFNANSPLPQLKGAAFLLLEEEQQKAIKEILTISLNNGKFATEKEEKNFILPCSITLICALLSLKGPL